MNRLLSVCIWLLIMCSLGISAEGALTLYNYQFTGTAQWAGYPPGDYPFSYSGFGGMGQHASGGGVTYSYPNGDGTYQRMTVLPNTYFYPLATVGSTWSGDLTFGWTGLPVASAGSSYLTMMAPGNDAGYNNFVAWYAKTSSGSARIHIGTNWGGHTPYLFYSSNPQPIPEPSSILVIFSGVAGISSLILRKRK